MHSKAACIQFVFNHLFQVDTLMGALAKTLHAGMGHDEHHELLTQSVGPHREPSDCERTGTTGRSTDRNERA